MDFGGVVHSRQRSNRSVDLADQIGNALGLYECAPARAEMHKALLLARGFELPLSSLQPLGLLANEPGVAPALFARLSACGIDL